MTSGHILTGVYLHDGVEELLNTEAPEGMQLVLVTSLDSVKLSPPKIEVDTRAEITKARKEVRFVESYNEVRVSDFAYARVEAGDLFIQKIDSNEVENLSIDDIDRQEFNSANDLDRILERSTSFEGVSRAVAAMGSALVNMQGLFEAGVKGDKTDEFVRFVRKEAGIVKKVLSDESLSGNLVFAKEQLQDLKKIDFGMHQTQMEADIDQRIRALDGFVEVLESEALAAMVDGIFDDSKFHADNLGNWLEYELPKFLGAIAGAVIAIIAVVTIIKSLGASAPIWAQVFGGSLAINSAVGSFGGIVGSELVAEGMYRLHGSGRRSLDGSYYGDRSRVGMYMEGRKIFDPVKGEMLEMDFTNDVLNPYAKQFAIGFVSSFAACGLGRWAAGFMSRAAQNSLWFQQTLAHSPVASRMATSLNTIKQLGRQVAEKGATGKFIVEFFDELGDEVFEIGLQQGLNMIDTRLGFAAAFLVVSAKGFRPIATPNFSKNFLGNYEYLVPVEEVRLWALKEGCEVRMLDGEGALSLTFPSGIKMDLVSGLQNVDIEKPINAEAYPAIDKGRYTYIETEDSLAKKTGIDAIRDHMFRIFDLNSVGVDQEVFTSFLAEVYEGMSEDSAYEDHHLRRQTQANLLKKLLPHHADEINDLFPSFYSGRCGIEVFDSMLSELSPRWQELIREMPATRIRAFSKFKLTYDDVSDQWIMEVLPGNEYTQGDPDDVRSLVRKFQPLPDGVVDHPEVQAFIQSIASISKEYAPGVVEMRFDLHMQGMYLNSEIQGWMEEISELLGEPFEGIDIVPEGPHIDEVDLNLANVIVEREGLDGGVNKFYGPDLVPWADSVLQLGEVAMLDDSGAGNMNRLNSPIHNVTPVRLKPGFETGSRLGLGIGIEFLKFEQDFDDVPEHIPAWLKASRLNYEQHLIDEERRFVIHDKSLADYEAEIDQIKQQYDDPREFQAVFKSYTSDVLPGLIKVLGRTPTPAELLRETRWQLMLFEQTMRDARQGTIEHASYQSAESVPQDSVIDSRALDFPSDASEWQTAPAEIRTVEVRKPDGSMQWEQQLIITTSNQRGGTTEHPVMTDAEMPWVTASADAIADHAAGGKVFIAGLGLGLLNKELDLRGVKTQVVAEINEDVVNKVGTRLKSEISGELDVRQGDFKIVLQQAIEDGELFDAISIDAFPNTPDEVNRDASSREVLRLALKALKPGGMLTFYSDSRYIPKRVMDVLIEEGIPKASIHYTVAEFHDSEFTNSYHYGRYMSVPTVIKPREVSSEDLQKMQQDFWDSF